MPINVPILFVEINYSNYIFVVGIIDEKENIKIIEKIIIKNEGIIENKFTNINQAQEIIKKNIHLIEDKLDCVFKEVTIIIDNFEYSSINISGFKKLNGFQVLKENISYILNSLKSVITENEKEKSILHIFNSKNILDGTSIENLPIGLYGDFYSHELTFFLIRSNDLKNIKQIFNKSNIDIKKVLIKNFIEGIQLINKDNNETFFKIKISKEKSDISFFDKSSYRYVEHFKFGSNIILKDIEKVCSINHEIISNILLDKFFVNKDYKEDEYLNEKYFTNDSYRKIRKKLILDIANARIEEISNIIFKKNININSFRKNCDKVYIIIEEEDVFENFHNSFESYFSKNDNFKTVSINDFQIDQLIINAANLLFYGWKKEAIPVTQSKNSLISKIFKSIFD
ncbi:MAG: hypothetical protein CBC88_02920 [Candidatus Pelagibacter sp. TMED128]|nr:MAG: hypothetical protein CBC88_02920 [Candidatus Pelagibacter sp. TMED128]|tara:strand:- start:2794 stop:3990 length:1197 start_codon:yes stop_codon:yes gene_type:complete